MVAEMERRFIRERQQAGIEAAKKAGVYKGRKPSVPVEKVRAMHEEGYGPTAIAKALKISRMSVHRALAQASVLSPPGACLSQEEAFNTSEAVPSTI
jgi:DNA invertase Pin-like site-specific DNA recombinase